MLILGAFSLGLIGLTYTALPWQIRRMHPLHCC
jgi:hypothetical protein